MDGGRIPHGWERPGFDDSAWETPAVICDAYARERPGDLGDTGGRWRLMPRDIPLLRAEVRQFGDWPGALAIPAHARREVILDAGECAIGYPILHTDGGREANVQIVYAGALTKDGHQGVASPIGTGFQGPCRRLSACCG